MKCDTQRRNAMPDVAQGAPWPPHTAADCYVPDPDRLWPTLNLTEARMGAAARELHLAERTTDGGLRTLCGRDVWARVGPLDEARRERCGGCFVEMIEADLR